MSTQDGNRNAERTGRSVANPRRVRLDADDERQPSADPHDQDWENVADEVREAVEDADGPDRSDRSDRSDRPGQRGGSS